MKINKKTLDYDLDLCEKIPESTTDKDQPNKETLEAIADVEKGKELVEVESVEDLFDELDL